MSQVQQRTTLTKSQEARRERVIRVAFELGSEGGYEAVQMRDVAAQAQVALGTIYRYFSSKDALLAAVMVLWLDDLERRVNRYPPAGTTTVERVTDVLGQALGSMQRNPRLTNAVVTAMTAGDPAGVEAMREVAEMFARILRPAFPQDVDSARQAAAATTLGHVWWSATIAWANGMGDMTWVADQLRQATELVVERFD